ATSASARSSGSGSGFWSSRGVLSSLASDSGAASAAAFLAGAFLAAVFFAAVFLAAVFFAAVFLAAVFFAVPLVDVPVTSSSDESAESADCDCVVLVAATNAPYTTRWKIGRAHV